MHIDTLVTQLKRLWKESGCSFDEFLILVDEVNPELAQVFEKNMYNKEFFVELHLGNMQSALRRVI